MTIEFPEFGKIPRLARDCTITEKIDGTNALISINGDQFFTGSRTRWITPDDDNYGFSAWAHAHREELMKLGDGNHYGEWWGSGIQKRYIGQPKTFSLFNTRRWAACLDLPACCSVVPILYEGIFSFEAVETALSHLRVNGSVANSECWNPEGIVIWHHASQTYFKKLLERDEEWKGKVA